MARNQLATRFVLGAMFAAPLMSVAQISHYDAKQEQQYHDAHHHTKAKIVGGSAVGGAVIGGLAGGGKGAVIGAGAGAGAGVLANKARKHHDIQQRERNEHY